MIKKLELSQEDKWPFSYTLREPVHSSSPNGLNMDVILPDLSSKDNQAEANARQANQILRKYLKLFTSAPEMYELFRDAILFMQFLGRNERRLTDAEQQWLLNAAHLLNFIEQEEED